MSRLERDAESVRPSDVKPGTFGPGPDDLVASGDIDETVPQGMFLELLNLMGTLKGRRQALGLSLTDVSERAGLTRQAISRLENGWNNNPTMETLYRYALALDAGVTLGVEDLEPPDDDGSHGHEAEGRPVLAGTPPRDRAEGGRYTESKVDCVIQFMYLPPGRPNGPATFVGQPHQATVHLVEFRLDGANEVWFGAADVACDLLEVTRGALAAGMDPVPEGWSRDLGDYLLQLRLLDGRKGAASAKASRSNIDAQAEYHRVDFMGMSKLA